MAIYIKLKKFGYVSMAFVGSILIKTVDSISTTITAGVA